MSFPLSRPWSVRRELCHRTPPAHPGQPPPHSGLLPIGESAPSPGGGTEPALSQLSSVEISLTLTGKPLPAVGGELSDGRSLLLR